MIGRGTVDPTLDKNKDTDFEWFLLEIMTFISVINGIIWRVVYVEKEILGNLDIILLSGVVNSIGAIWGLIKALFVGIK